MTRCIAVFNQAGGVAKTTLTQNLGYHLGQKKQRVLLIDLDPQASLTTFMGLVPNEMTKTIYQTLVLNDPLPIHKNLHEVDFVPSNIHLCAAEQELTAEIMRELKLKKALTEVENEYDFILVDCPPSLGILSILSLVAATHILVPIHCHYKAFMGTDQLLATISKVRKAANSTLEIAGFVPTLLDKRASQDYRMLSAIKEQLGALAPVFPAIPRSVVFADASEEHKPLALYKKNHPAVMILEQIASNLIEL